MTFYYKVLNNKKTYKRVEYKLGLNIQLKNSYLLYFNDLEDIKYMKNYVTPYPAWVAKITLIEDEHVFKENNIYRTNSFFIEEFIPFKEF